MLRVTHDAIITSLSRYGLAVVGSCCPDGTANRMDPAIINTAARRISGLPVSARIEVLHFLAGTHSFRNLYIRRCAASLHQVLLSYDGAARKRLVADILAISRVSQIPPAVEPVAFDIAKTFLTDSPGLPTFLLQQTKWMRNYYHKIPSLEGIQVPTSTYAVHATEIEQPPHIGNTRAPSHTPIRGWMWPYKHSHG